MIFQNLKYSPGNICMLNLKNAFLLIFFLNREVKFKNRSWFEHIFWCQKKQKKVCSGGSLWWEVTQGQTKILLLCTAFLQRWELAMLACNYTGPTAKEEWEERKSSPFDKDTYPLQWDGKIVSCVNRFAFEIRWSASLRVLEGTFVSKLVELYPLTAPPSSAFPFLSSSLRSFLPPKHRSLLPTLTLSSTAVVSSWGWHLFLEPALDHPACCITLLQVCCAPGSVPFIRAALSGTWLWWCFWWWFFSGVPWTRQSKPVVHAGLVKLTISGLLIESSGRDHELSSWAWSYHLARSCCPQTCLRGQSLLCAGGEAPGYPKTLG